jgi:hypothetical protein
VHKHRPLGKRVRVVAEERDSLSAENIQGDAGAHPPSKSLATMNSFPWSKAAVGVRLTTQSLSTNEFKNEWICTPISFIRLHGMDRDIITFHERRPYSYEESADRFVYRIVTLAIQKLDTTCIIAA